MNSTTAPIVSDFAAAYVNQGQQMMQEQIGRVGNLAASQLKYYFMVDNKYVAKKLLLLACPFIQVVLSSEHGCCIKIPYATHVVCAWYRSSVCYIIRPLPILSRPRARTKGISEQTE